MKSINKREKGNEKEELAVNYLKNNGFTILKRNYYTRYGEIDIVAKKENVLYFVEVKYRKNLSMGYPEESISKRKRHHLLMAVRRYRAEYFVKDDVPMRLSLIAILGDRIIMIENI